MISEITGSRYFLVKFTMRSVLRTLGGNGATKGFNEGCHLADSETTCAKATE